MESLLLKCMPSIYAMLFRGRYLCKSNSRINIWNGMEFKDMNESKRNWKRLRQKALKEKP